MRVFVRRRLAATVAVLLLTAAAHGQHAPGDPPDPDIFQPPGSSLTGYRLDLDYSGSWWHRPRDHHNNFADGIAQPPPYSPWYNKNLNATSAPDGTITGNWDYANDDGETFSRWLKVLDAGQHDGIGHIWVPGRNYRDWMGWYGIGAPHSATSFEVGFPPGSYNLADIPKVDEHEDGWGTWPNDHADWEKFDISGVPDHHAIFIPIDAPLPGALGPTPEADHPPWLLIGGPPPDPDPPPEPDEDGDGIPDDDDPDDDGDGIPDECDADHPDNAGETDADGDGIIDTSECSDTPTDDHDGDGVSDACDADHPLNAAKPDSDGDGIIDECEAGAPPDPVEPADPGDAPETGLPSIDAVIDKLWGYLELVSPLLTTTANGHALQTDIPLSEVSPYDDIPVSMEFYPTDDTWGGSALSIFASIVYAVFRVSIYWWFLHAMVGLVYEI